MCEQGGILFWLQGNLQDLLDISSEIALIKLDNNQKSCNNEYFLKLTVIYPY